MFCNDDNRVEVKKMEGIKKEDLRTCRMAVFDLDGTLVDSLQDLSDSANRMLESYGFPLHAVQEYRYFVGNGSGKLIERCLPKEESKNSDFVREALLRYKEIYAKHSLDKTKPYEEVMEMLEKLRSLGIPLGVCTNKHQSAAEYMVERLFPSQIFSVVLGDTQGQPLKPDPVKILRMAEHFCVSPREVAYFGDSGVDMDTAKNGGFLSVGVLWGLRPREELEKHGAQVLLSHPMELFEKIKFEK